MNRPILHRMVMTAMLLGGCSRSTVTPQAGLSEPDVPSRSIDAAFAVDTDGDGVDELVSLAGGMLTGASHAFEAPGSASAFHAGSLSGQSGEILVIGLGRSRAHPNAPTTLVKYDRSGFQSLPLPSLNGSRITDIQVSPHGILISILDQKKRGTSYWVRDNEMVPAQSSTMGLQQRALDDGSGIVIGRLYGDEPRSHGGLELVSTQGVRRTLPSQRGVRTLELADLNRDGAEDILIGDSWHYRYGQSAQATLAVLLGPDFQRRIPIGTIADSYTVQRAVVLPDTDTVKIVAIGSSSASLFVHHEIGWTQTRLTDLTPTAHVAVWSSRQSRSLQAGSNWLVVSGNSPRSIRIREENAP